MWSVSRALAAARPDDRRRAAGRLVVQTDAVCETSANNFLLIFIFRKTLMPDFVKLIGNDFRAAILLFPCPQKILMVTDSSLNFGTGGFGLSEFKDIVTSAGHTVSTAHRSGTAPVTIAGNFNFQTAATAVTLANYDQMWLFGFSTAALTGPEQQVIAAFMNSGGGVFATGDHSTIGAGMGNNIPRVRLMRDWAGVPMASQDRHDTVVDIGPDNIKQFSDQSDDLPQRIFPIWLSNGGDQFTKSTWSVHPVLRHSSGAVDFLPDHPHESQCFGPAGVAGNFAGVEEWPQASDGSRPGAMVAAVSVSGGRFVESGAPTASGTKPPVIPKLFGAISAYDGDRANVGRVVCDATWHHFVNINLNGSGSGREAMKPGGVATGEYLKIQTYYKNTVRWLAPRGRRNCWPWLQVVAVRFTFELLEELRPEPHPCPWDPLIRIGALTEEALTREFGPGAADTIVADLLANAKGAPALARAMRMRQPKTLKEGESDIDLLPRTEIRRAILGELMNAIVRDLPVDAEKLAEVLRKNHDELAVKHSMLAVETAQRTVAGKMAGARKTLDMMFDGAVN